MEFKLTAEETEFRDEVRAFLQRELKPEVSRAHRDGSEQGMWSTEFTKEFRHKLGAAGYLGMGWPQEYDGAGAGVVSIRRSSGTRWNTNVRPASTGP